MDKETQPGPVPRGRVPFGRGGHGRKWEALGLGCGPAAAETPGGVCRKSRAQAAAQPCHRRPGVGPGRWEPTGVTELRSRPLAGRSGSGLEGGGQAGWGLTCLPGAGLRSGCQGLEPDRSGQREAGKQAQQERVSAFLPAFPRPGQGGLDASAGQCLGARRPQTGLPWEPGRGVPWSPDSLPGRISTP